jgi:hypothetical protein
VVFAGGAPEKCEKGVTSGKLNFEGGHQKQ